MYMDLPPLPESLQPSDGLTRTEVDQAIANALANYPLYRKLKLHGQVWKRWGDQLRFSGPHIISLYCRQPGCEKLMNWTEDEDNDSVSKDVRRTNPVSVLAHTGFWKASYQCNNCQRSLVTYFLFVTLSEVDCEITKVGQWPPLSREPDPVVSASWSETDLKLYSDALTFRHANKGIGALPYLRRIIENHMHDVLRLIEEAHALHPIANFDEAKLQAARKSHRFENKLDVARDYLPSTITPKGHANPIGTLYGLISEGLHEKTEEECIDIFDNCRVAFEFVVRKLTEAKREDDSYIRSLNKLSKSRSES